MVTLQMESPHTLGLATERSSRRKDPWQRDVTFSGLRPEQMGSIAFPKVS